MQLKKAILAAMLIIILAITSIPAFAGVSLRGRVTASALNIRAANSIESEKIGILYSGDIVNIVNKEDGGWYKITLSDERFGYVKEEYIALIDNDTTSRDGDNLSMGEKVLEYAKTFVGVPYKYGGSSPSGFDCSGFTMYVYKHFGVDLPHSASAQANYGTYVEKSELKPGDLVFFKKPGKSIHHVGIYAGNGYYIHAPQTGKTISVVPMTRSDYYTARRIFN